MKRNEETRIFLGTVITGMIILTIMMFATQIPAVECCEISANWYDTYVKKLGLEEDFCERAGISFEEATFFNPSELDCNTVVAREGLIVEKFIGICVDDDKNGQVINTETDFDYISYKGLDILAGDIVVTYCLYNPDTKYENDIIWREDYVIDTDQLIEEVG